MNCVWVIILRQERNYSVFCFTTRVEFKLKFTVFDVGYRKLSNKTYNIFYIITISIAVLQISVGIHEIASKQMFKLNFKFVCGFYLLNFQLFIYNIRNKNTVSVMYIHTDISPSIRITTALTT